MEISYNSCSGYRHKCVPGDGESENKTMKKGVIYALSYIATVYFLVQAVLAPHADGAHVVFYFVLSIFITFFNSTSIMKSTLLLVIAPWYTFFYGFPRKNVPRMGEQVISPRLSLPDRENADPLVSVVIPCFNEENGITTTLKSILASSYPRLEIIIVNDGSTDNSDMVIRQFLHKYEQAMGNSPYRVPIIYHTQPNSGKKAGPVNTAIQISHGDIIVNMDADTYLHKDAIMHFVRTFQRDRKLMGIGGNIHVGNTGSLLADLQSIDYCFGYYSRRADSLLGTFHIVSGTCGAFRREVFQRIGLYDTTTMTEDIEITMRMLKAGMKVIYLEKAVAYTEVPTKLKPLFKQRLRWGRGHAESFGKHKDLLFSTKKEHNKIFSWAFMPLIAFHEWTSLIVIILRYILYTYCILFGANELLAFIIIINMITVGIALLNDKESRKLVLLSPIIWIIYLPLLTIATAAITKATYQVVRGKEAEAWQRWERQGVSSRAHLQKGK